MTPVVLSSEFQDTLSTLPLLLPAIIKQVNQPKQHFPCVSYLLSNKHRINYSHDKKERKKRIKVSFTFIDYTYQFI